MVLEILCVEPIYPQYSGVLETCLALRYWFFEVLGSESVNPKLTGSMVHPDLDCTSCAEKSPDKCPYSVVLFLYNGSSEQVGESHVKVLQNMKND